MYSDNQHNQHILTSAIVENNTIKIGPITKNILNIKENAVKINDLKSFNNIIEDVLFGIGFSSKKIGYDEFVKEYYDSSLINEYIINGVENYYNYPRGVVLLHESNKIFYDAANILFMINNNILPINHISCNIDLNKTIKIPRSNGTIQNGYISKNTALRISRSVGGIYIHIVFKDLEQNMESQKHVKFNVLFNLNLIDKFSINIPQLKKDNYDFKNYKYLSNELIDEIIETYNSNIKEFIETFVKNFTEYNIIYNEEEVKYDLSHK